ASKGETLRLMGRYEEALATFDQALELKPDYEWALASKGVTLLLMEHYEEALKTLDQALAIDPNYDWALAARGTTLRRMGHFYEALIALDQALALDPQDDWYYYQRGLTYAALGKHQEAHADYKTAIRLAQATLKEKSARAATHFNLALYLLVAGQPNASIAAYQQGIAMALGRWTLHEALQDLTDLEAQEGKLPGMEEAIELLQEALAAAPRNSKKKRT
ncbi:MAG: tetratricopeptide repeat protein, partial [Anaerolineae bacterium]